MFGFSLDNLSMAAVPDKITCFFCEDLITLQSHISIFVKTVHESVLLFVQFDNPGQEGQRRCQET